MRNIASNYKIRVSNSKPYLWGPLPGRVAQMSSSSLLPPAQPCGTFTLDLTSAQFGMCQNCGYHRREHGTSAWAASSGIFFGRGLRRRHVLGSRWRREVGRLCAAAVSRGIGSGGALWREDRVRRGSRPRARGWRPRTGRRSCPHACRRKMNQGRARSGGRAEARGQGWRPMLTFFGFFCDIRC